MSSSARRTRSSLPTRSRRQRIAGDFSNLLNVENRLVTTAGGPVTDPSGQPDPKRHDLRSRRRKRLLPTGRPTASRSPAIMIPLSRFDPTISKILPLVPLPQGSNADRGLLTDNYINPTDSTRHSNIRSIKLDQNMGDKGRISLYLQETNTMVNRTPTGLSPLPDLISSGSESFSSGTTVRLNYDYTITPRLLLHLGAGWNDNDFILRALVSNYNAATELGLRGGLTAKYFPVILTNASTNNAIGGMSQLGNSGPTASFDRRPSGTVSASYVTGSHTSRWALTTVWKSSRSSSMRYRRGNTPLGPPQFPRLRRGAFPWNRAAFAGRTEHKPGFCRVRFLVLPAGRNDYRADERADRFGRHQVADRTLCAGHVESHAEADHGLRSPLGLRYVCGTNSMDVTLRSACWFRTPRPATAWVVRNSSRLASASSPATILPHSAPAWVQRIRSIARPCSALASAWSTTPRPRRPVRKLIRPKPARLRSTPAKRPAF